MFPIYIVLYIFLDIYTLGCEQCLLKTFKSDNYHELMFIHRLIVILERRPLLTLESKLPECRLKKNK